MQQSNKERHWIAHPKGKKVKSKSAKWERIAHAIRAKRKNEWRKTVHSSHHGNKLAHYCRVHVTGALIFFILNSLLFAYKRSSNVPSELRLHKCIFEANTTAQLREQLRPRNSERRRLCIRYECLASIIKAIWLHTARIVCMRTASGENHTNSNAIYDDLQHNYCNLRMLENEWNNALIDRTQFEPFSFN